MWPAKDYESAPVGSVCNSHGQRVRQLETGAGWPQGPMQLAVNSSKFPSNQFPSTFTRALAWLLCKYRVQDVLAVRWAARGVRESPSKKR